MNQPADNLPAAAASPQPCECERIEAAKGLDPIHVFWIDVAPGAGYVTVICYGRAWTAYFGAMNGKTIRQFVKECDTEYLVNKMSFAGQISRDTAYLQKIVEAVRESLAQGVGPTPPQGKD